MDKLETFRAFVETAQSGNFSAAARRLGVAPSVVMKRVNHLEKLSHGPLFQRSTRHLALTDLGQRALPTIRTLLIEADGIFGDLHRYDKQLTGHLRIGAPPAITTMHLHKLLADFLRSHPGVSMDLVTIDHPADPVERGFDIAIGAFTTSFKRVTDVPLYPLTRWVCASPDYLRRAGTPHKPNELFEHSCLQLLPLGKVWSFRTRRGPVTIEIRPKFASDDSRVLCEAAIDGVGIAILPSYVAQPAIRGGHLVRLLKSYPIAEVWIKAFLPDGARRKKLAEALLEHLQQRISPTPPWMD
jgi:DNA-binding transcriptional LysR family regulator